MVPHPGLGVEPAELGFEPGRSGMVRGEQSVVRRQWTVFNADDQAQGNTLRGVRSTIMRLGLIADIHADHRALESALRHLDHSASSTILCAGDLVGYGTQADAVVALIRDTVDPLRPGQPRPLGPGTAAGHRLARLEGGRVPARDLGVPGRRCRRAPASPAAAGASPSITARRQPIPSTSRPTSRSRRSIDRFWDEGDAEVLVLGHTHIPMVDRTAARHGHQPGIDPGRLRASRPRIASPSSSSRSSRSAGTRSAPAASSRRDPIFLEET